MTSPGAKGASACTAATDAGIAPRCTGMCAACATIWPRASNTAHERSRRSRMLGERLERTSAAPISSATELSSELKIDSTTGSTAISGPPGPERSSRSLDNEVAPRVHRRAPAGRNERCAVELGYKRCAFDHVVRAQLLAVVNGRFEWARICM